ncbi:hypothetical protein [Campylobacter concisus]|uniref:hypothetical protein n=1 Tax=Campylobacter concisus TaxID=199 RepID=UPI0011301D8D|nr:hypothetical protein [Campylobacter concisus]
MASFDLAGSSHKPTNTSHSSQAHIASTHTKTNRHIKLPRNFFVILITSDKQSTNSHVFRPTLCRLRRTRSRTIQVFISKLARPIIPYHLAIKPYNATVKEILTVEFLHSHAIK